MDPHAKETFPSEKDTMTPSGASTASTDKVIQEKSKGVVEMENLIGRLSPVLKGIIYGSFTILAYVLSLSEFSNALLGTF